MAHQSTYQNHILAHLAADDFASLEGRLERVDIVQGTVLAKSNEPLEFVHFPESGVMSLVARSATGQRVEAGIIGREGFIHPAVVLGTDRVPQDVESQIPGASNRLLSADLLRLTAASAPLRRTLLLFAQANTIQITQTMLSNAIHHLDQRLARWLLMCHDRSDSDDLHLTHQYIGLMLAVRRPSVTTGLHVLEGNGLIELARGFIVISNRAALEIFAGDAYGVPEAEYRRLLGPL